jgi:hypothetical protein
MKWIELALSATAHTYFPNGAPIHITYLPEDSSSYGKALVELNSTRVTLDNVVDDGETTETPRIFKLTGAPSDALLLLGGTNVYRIDSTGKAALTTTLNRDTVNTEFWNLQLIASQQGALIIYESGIALIDSLLKQKWHVPKRYNDFFSKLENNRLWLLEDHELLWFVDLSTGTRSRPD